MSSLSKKFGNSLLGLNHASISDPDFTWVRGVDKIKGRKLDLAYSRRQHPVKKTTWVGIAPLDNKCLMTSLKIKSLRCQKVTIDYQIKYMLSRFCELKKNWYSFSLK